MACYKCKQNNFSVSGCECHLCYFCALSMVHQKKLKCKCGKSTILRKMWAKMDHSDRIRIAKSMKRKPAKIDIKNSCITFAIFTNKIDEYDADD